MLSRSTWKYLKNIRSYKYQNDEKGQRVLIEKMSEISVLFVSISIVRNFVFCGLFISVEKTPTSSTSLLVKQTLCNLYIILNKYKSNLPITKFT